jgi:hypothetical protein
MANEALMYSGQGDSFLDFTGNASDFGSEASFDKIFRITIINANVADQDVILNPSYNPSNALRVVRDGVIPYAAGQTDLSATGSPNTIAELLAFIKANPTGVNKLTIKSNNAAQLQQAIILSVKSPFSTPQSERINLESFISEFASNDKLATIKREFQLDDQTEALVKIPGAVGGVATSTTFTFYFGATLNAAKALRSKKTIALQNPVVQQTKGSLK